jgi:hypothetical protein
VLCSRLGQLLCARIGSQHPEDTATVSQMPTYTVCITVRVILGLGFRSHVIGQYLSRHHSWSERSISKKLALAIHLSIQSDTHPRLWDLSRPACTLSRRSNRSDSHAGNHRSIFDESGSQRGHYSAVTDKSGTWRNYRDSTSNDFGACTKGCYSDNNAGSIARFRFEPECSGSGTWHCS